VTRRSLFRAFLTAAAAPIALGTSASAAPTSSTIPTGTWVTLPGTNLHPTPPTPPAAPRTSPPHGPQTDASPPPGLYSSPSPHPRAGRP